MNRNHVHTLQALAGRLLAMLLAGALCACGAVTGLTGAPGTQGTTAPAPPAPGGPAAGPVDQAGVCVDGTGSSAAHYAADFKSQVAAATSGWTPPVPARRADGVDGQPGLHLVVRSVTTTSGSTDGHSVNDTIPAVTRLAAQPRPGPASYADDYRSWLTAESGWEAADNTAVAQARKVSAEVSRYQVVRNTHSGVYSCLTGAMNELNAPGPQMRLVVMSDLENNEPIGDLTLAQARVLLVTVCPSNVSISCPQRFAVARKFLLSHGASNVSAISVDAVTPQVLASFWRS